MARTCVDAGWLLSLSGTVSFRNAHALREAATLIPPEQLLVETDAPFLTPHPYRGAPNESYCLPYTVRALAEVVGRPADRAGRRDVGERRPDLRIPYADGELLPPGRFRYRPVIDSGRHADVRAPRPDSRG